MAIVQALLSALSRRMGKIVNTLFGWATSMLYGKVPPKRQIVLSIMSMISVLWLVVVVGLAFPRAGVFLLSFVKVSSEHTELIRWIMLGACIVLPMVSGVLSLYLKDPAERPAGGRGKSVAVLKGYPFTFGMGLSLVILLVVAPFLKIADLLRRWKSEHIQIMIEPEDYRALVEEVREILRRGGIETAAVRPGWTLRAPMKIMTVFGGGAANDVAERLTVLKSPELEAVLLPFDVHVRAKAGLLLRTRARLARELPFGRAFLTWNKEAQNFERRLRSIWERRRNRPLAAWTDLKKVEWDLEKTDLPFEEWEVLFREKLILENELWAIQAETAAYRAGGRAGKPLFGLLRAVRRSTRRFMKVPAVSRLQEDKDQGETDDSVTSTQHGPGVFRETSRKSSAV
jgi:hypothetical protein